MNTGSGGGSKDQGSIDFEAFGKALVEEVLFHGGLEAADASVKIDEAIVSLQFQISVDEAERSIEIELERIGSTSIKLQIQL